MFHSGYIKIWFHSWYYMNAKTKVWKFTMELILEDKQTLWKKTIQSMTPVEPHSSGQF